jgi:hypothetical protein
VAQLSILASAVKKILIGFLFLLGAGEIILPVVIGNKVTFNRA